MKGRVLLMNKTEDVAAEFVGKTAEQVCCETPEYQHLVGRKSLVEEVLVDEKGQIHIRTADGIWCPLRLCSML